MIFFPQLSSFPSHFSIAMEQWQSGVDGPIELWPVEVLTIHDNDKMRLRCQLMVANVRLEVVVSEVDLGGEPGMRIYGLGGGATVKCWAHGCFGRTKAEVWQRFARQSRNDDD